MTRDKHETGLFFFKDPLGNLLVPAPPSTPPSQAPPALKLVRLGHTAEAYYQGKRKDPTGKAFLPRRKGTQNHLEQPWKRARQGDRARVLTHPQPRITDQRSTVKIQRGQGIPEQSGARSHSSGHSATQVQG